MKRAALPILVLLLAWFLWPRLSNIADNEGTSQSQAPNELLAEVMFVIDGDTIELDIDDQHERVRLIGIDTPETVSKSVPVQCYGAEASEALKGLLPVGSLVRIERGEEARDRYGRLLLYVYRHEDDLFVNQWLIEGGYADSVSYAPNDDYARHFDNVRAEAKSAGRGLWGVCDGPDQPLE